MRRLSRQSQCGRKAVLIYSFSPLAVALGLDEADTNRQNLEVYRSAFEAPFITATETYYKAESEQFLAGNSVTEYMKKAEGRLQDEENRVDLYLHASTRKNLIQKCEEVLVKNHAEIMQEEFQRVRSWRPSTAPQHCPASENGTLTGSPSTLQLLDQEQEPDLHRMFLLLSRIASGLGPLRERFEAHVKKAGLDSVERSVGSTVASVPAGSNGAGEGSSAGAGKEKEKKEVAVEPKAYVDSLLAVHRKNNELVAKAFRGDQGFVASLDRVGPPPCSVARVKALD